MNAVAQANACGKAVRPCPWARIVASTAVNSAVRGPSRSVSTEEMVKARSRNSRRSRDPVEDRTLAEIVDDVYLPLVGRVREVTPASRRPARTAAAPDPDPSATRTQSRAPHAESTHRP